MSTDTRGFALMSRTAWIFWCLAWALFWLTFGFLLLPVVNLGLAGLAVVAVLIPVGKERTDVCEVCRGSYPAANMPLHLSYRHGIGPSR